MEIVTAFSARKSMHDWMDYDLEADALAKAAALRWVDRLGHLLLQAHEFESALAWLASTVSGLDHDQRHKFDRMTAGQLLRHCASPLLSNDEMQTLQDAVDLRNRIAHGRLTIAVARLFPTDEWAEIGVDVWHHHSGTVQVVADDIRLHDDPNMESLETWVRQLGKATWLVGEILERVDPWIPPD